MRMLVDHVGKQRHFCLSCERCFHDHEALDCNVLDYDTVT